MRGISALIAAPRSYDAISTFPTCQPEMPFPRRDRVRSKNISESQTDHIGATADSIEKTEHSGAVMHPDKHCPWRLLRHPKCQFEHQVVKQPRGAIMFFNFKFRIIRGVRQTFTHRKTTCSDNDPREKATNATPAAH